MGRAAILAAAVLLAACGRAGTYTPRTTLVPPVESTPQPTTSHTVDRSRLEALITTTTNKNWTESGFQGRVSRTTCYQDDALLFTCDIEIVGSPNALRALTLAVVCDGAGICTWGLKR